MDIKETRLTGYRYIDDRVNVVIKESEHQETITKLLQDIYRAGKDDGFAIGTSKRLNDISNRN